MPFTLRRSLAAVTLLLALAVALLAAAQPTRAACSTSAYFQVASKKIGAATLVIYQNGCKDRYKGHIYGGLKSSKVKLRMNDGKDTGWYAQPSNGVPATTIAMYAGPSVTRVWAEGYEVTKFGPVTGTLNFYR
jgi:hypothetical protein